MYGLQRGFEALRRPACHIAKAGGFVAWGENSIKIPFGIEKRDKFCYNITAYEMTYKFYNLENLNMG